MADVKWIKINVDMFDNRKIKHLRKLPDGNAIVLIWVMLLTLAGRCNAGGMVFLTETIPYTPEMLADELGFDVETINTALSLLSQLGMIQTDGCLAITNWDEYQNIDRMAEIREYNRVAKQKSREKQAQLKASVNDMSMTSQRRQDTDIEEDIEKENKKKNTERKKERTGGGYDSIISGFTESEDLKNALYEFLKMRKLIRKPMTDKGLTLMLGKLADLSSDPGTQIAILNQSIMNNWAGVFPLKGEVGPNGVRLSGETTSILDGIL